LALLLVFDEEIVDVKVQVGEEWSVHVLYVELVLPLRPTNQILVHIGILVEIRVD